VKPVPEGTSGASDIRSMMMGPLTPTAPRWMWKPVTVAGSRSVTVTLMSKVLVTGCSCSGWRVAVAVLVLEGTCWSAPRVALRQVCPVQIGRHPASWRR